MNNASTDGLTDEQIPCDYILSTFQLGDKIYQKVL